MIRWKRMLSSIMAILIAASLTSPSYTFAESLSIYGTSTNFAGIAGTENDTAEQEVSGQADGGEGEEAEEAEDDAAWEEEAAEGGSVQEPDPEEAGEEDDAAEARPALDGDRLPCSYCPYGTVCGFDPAIPGYEYRRIEKLSDDEAIDRMRKELGKVSDTADEGDDLS